MEILATDRDGDVDECLKPIAEKIHDAVPQLTGFKAGKLMKKSLTVGHDEKFELVDDQVVRVAVVPSASPGKVIRLKLSAPQMSEVTYETSSGRYLPIITKYRTKNREVLILAISVQPGP